MDDRDEDGLAIGLDSPITDIDQWLGNLGFSITQTYYIECVRCNYGRVAVTGWETDPFCLLVLINHRLMHAPWEGQVNEPL